MAVGGRDLGDDLDEAILTAKIDTVADYATEVRIFPVITGLLLFVVHVEFGSPFVLLMKARDSDKEERSSAGSDSTSPRRRSGKKFRGWRGGVSRTNTEFCGWNHPTN